MSKIDDGTIGKAKTSTGMKAKPLLRLATLAVTATSVLYLVALEAGLQPLHAGAVPAAMWVLVITYLAGEYRGGNKMAEALAWRERMDGERSVSQDSGAEK